MSPSRFVVIVFVAVVVCVGFPSPNVSVHAAQAVAQPFSRQARLEPRTSAPITIGATDAREAFQSVADQAGIQVFFHRAYAAQPLPAGFALKNVSVLEALDRLCSETQALWEVYDSRIVLVAPEQRRAEVEPRVLKSYGLTSETFSLRAPTILAALEGAPPIKAVAVSSPTNAILARAAAGTALDRVEQIIAGAGTNTGGDGVLTDSAGNVFTVEAGRLRKNPAQAHMGLQPSAATVSARLNQLSRQTFETVAQQAGIRVVFHRQFVNQAQFQFAVQDVDVATAFDLLSFVTGNFWVVHDPHTIIVATDNPTVRREVESLIIKSIPLWTMAPQRVTEVVTALRSLAAINSIASKSTPFGQGAAATNTTTLMVRDTADKVALAERIVAMMDRAFPGAPARSIPSGLFQRPHDEEAMKAERARLVRVSSASISMRMTQPSRPTFETLAAAAGLRIIFHRQFVNAPAFPFVVENADVFDALDLLCFQTQNFWVANDARTIVVATDNPTVRREVEQLIVKTIHFRNGTPRKEVTEIVTALRTLLSFNQIGLSAETGAMVLRDTPGKVALAEKIVAILDESASTNTTPIPSGVFQVPTDPARNLRRRLALQLSTDPVSVRINLSSKESFETLCRLAGVNCVFHRQFVTSPVLPFAVENVDILTAFDILAFQTQNFWEVQEPPTIIIGTDNPTIRREVEKPITRTINLENITTLNGMTELTTILRTVIGANAVEPNWPIGLNMTDTLDKVDLAERIIKTIDLPGRAPLAP